jgi:hypothetical protein
MNNLANNEQLPIDPHSIPKFCNIELVGILWELIGNQL